MKFNLFGIKLSEEDNILLRSVADKITLAEKHFSPKFTFFLDERQSELVEMIFKNSGFDNYVLYGGYDNAKRKILAVTPPYSYANLTDFPLKAVTFSYRNVDSISHRDILGSLMALNIERKTVGDILVGEGKSVVFLYDTVIDDVLFGIKKIGRIGVKVYEGFDEEIIPEEKFKEISGTIASLRLDCVLSLALKISREKAANLIKKNGVVVNCQEQFSISYEMKENDKFSIKGFGKFVFSSINGTSKKDRIHITIKKYI